MGLSAGKMAVALGLRDMGEIMQLAAFVGRIKSSTLPVIREAIECGLPRHCVSALPNNRQLRCPHCRNMVNMVPCPSCARAPTKLRPGLRISKDPPPPTAATNYKPGTIDKIEELRARFGRGESLFHEDDATFDDIGHCVHSQ